MKYLERSDEAEFVATHFYLITTGGQLSGDYTARIITFYRNQMFPAYLPSGLSHLLKTKDFTIFHSSKHKHNTWFLKLPHIMSPKDQEKHRHEVKAQLSGEPTCAHSDGIDELIPPAVRSHQQSQVGFLDQLVHCVLPDRETATLVHTHTQHSSMFNSLVWLLVTILLLRNLDTKRISGIDFYSEGPVYPSSLVWAYNKIWLGGKKKSNVCVCVCFVSHSGFHLSSAPHMWFSCAFQWLLLHFSTLLQISAALLGPHVSCRARQALETPSIGHATC